MSNDHKERDKSNLTPIPEEIQDLSVEEFVEAVNSGSGVPTEKADQTQSSRGSRAVYSGRMTHPGRIPGEDSIDASSEDPRGTDQGYVFQGYDTPAGTRIGGPEDDDSDTERLRQLNEGRHRATGDLSVQEAQREKEHISRAICQDLPLSEIEEEKVIEAVEQIEFSIFGNQKSIIRVVLGTVAVVIDENVRPPDEFEDAISRCDKFREIREAHDISMSDISTVKEKVRQSIRDGDVSIPHGIRIPRRDPTLPGPTPYEDMPEEYWKSLSPEGWQDVARRWSYFSDRLKQAIPPECAELVENIRRWEPWEMNRSNGGEETAAERPSPADFDPPDEGGQSAKEAPELSEEELKELEDFEERLEKLEDEPKDEIQQAVEDLMEQMPDHDDD